MRKAEYWQKRMLLLEDSSHRDARKCLNSVLKSFDAAQIKINNEIAKWIQRIADNEGISLAEARKRLDARELDEFRWTVEEYIARGEENALNGKWMKQLENASARAHVSRWEALNLSIEEYLQEVYGTENRSVESLLSDVASSRYTHTAFEIMNGIGIASSINVLVVETIIKNPWATDDRIFSSRIWSNMAETKAALQDALLRQFLTGAAPDQAIRTMEQYVDEEIGHARSRAGRLIMTESAAIGNKAQMQCYKDLGVEEYEIIATLDSVTCSHCGGKDGLHYPMDAERIGYTAPPFHANCRCCTAPYFEDERSATRMMRNPKTGKSEYVENMTYEEWAKKYLKDYHKSAILNRARNIRSTADLDRVSSSPVTEFDSIDEIKDYFKRKHDVDVSGFEKKELFGVKATMAGYDDMLTEFPEIRDTLKRIGYNSHSHNCGTYNTLTLSSKVGPKGLQDYGTGIHEAAHALDKARSVTFGEYSSDIVEKARKNLKLRSNSNEFKDLRIRLCGNLEYTDTAEIFAYAIESEKGLSGNKLSAEIMRLIKEDSR